MSADEFCLFVKMSKVNFLFSLPGYPLPPWSLLLLPLHWSPLPHPPPHLLWVRQAGGEAEDYPDPCWSLPVSHSSDCPVHNTNSWSGHQSRYPACLWPYSGLCHHPSLDCVLVCHCRLSGTQAQVHRVV